MTTTDPAAQADLKTFLTKWLEGDEKYAQEIIEEDSWVEMPASTLAGLLANHTDELRYELAQTQARIAKMTQDHYWSAEPLPCGHDVQHWTIVPEFSGTEIVGIESEFCMACRAEAAERELAQAQAERDSETRWAQHYHERAEAAEQNLRILNIHADQQEEDLAALRAALNDLRQRHSELNGAWDCKCEGCKIARAALLPGVATKESE